MKMIWDAEYLVMIFILNVKVTNTNTMIKIQRSIKEGINISYLLEYYLSMKLQ